MALMVIVDNASITVSMPVRDYTQYQFLIGWYPMGITVSLAYSPKKAPPFGRA